MRFVDFYESMKCRGHGVTSCSLILMNQFVSAMVINHRFRGSRSILVLGKMSSFAQHFDGSLNVVFFLFL